MSARSRLRRQCRVSTALYCTLAAIAAFSATPAAAADECGPVPLGGGTIECPTADYPTGISYDAGVEDLTIVVDSGSTLEGGFNLIGDGNLSAGLEDVAVATAGNFEAGVSLDSTAGDLFIEASDVSTSGDGAAGIYARATGGYTLIYSGTVATTGDGSAGLQVISDGGNQSIITDLTSTTGQGSVGISAGSKTGDIDVLASGVDTSGDYSAAVQIDTASGDITLQGGALHTSGYDSDAVDLSTVSGDIQSSSVDVVTHGDSSDGINAVSGSGNVTIHNGFNSSTGTITTYGDFSDGIHVETGGDITVESDSVHTYGILSYAIDLSSVNGDIGVDSNDITTAGNYSMGIHAVAQTGSINIDNGFGGTDGLITTNGNWSHGIAAYALDGDVTVASDTIETYGDHSYGIGVVDNGATYIDSGRIATQGYGSTGIHVNGGAGPLSVTSGTIATEGTYAFGIEISSNGGPAQVKSDTVDTRGDSAAGIVVTGRGGEIDIDSGSVVTHGSAQYLGYAYYGYNNAVKFYYYGQGSYGIVALNFDGAVSINSDSVTTYGNLGYGIYAATNHGSVVVQSGDVVTHGSGVKGYAVYGFPVYFGGSVGISALSIYGGGNVTVTSNSVKTYGNGSGGIRAAALTGTTDVQSGFVETFGIGAPGIFAISGTYFNYYFDNAYDLGATVTADTVITHGQGSTGVVVASDGAGDATANLNYVHTYGFISAGIFVESGGYFNIPDNELRWGNSYLNVEKVRTDGDLSPAIEIQSEGGNVTAIAGDIVTTGYVSAGVLANGTPLFDFQGGTLQVGEVSVTVDNVKTYGFGSSAVAAQSNGGGVNVSVGNAETAGDYSAGVIGTTYHTLNYFYSGPPYPIYGNGRVYSGDVVLAAENVTTAGAHSVGVVARSDAGNVSVDAANVATSGDVSAGIVVRTTQFYNYVNGLTYFGDAAITAGSVTTSGDKSDGIVAASYAGDLTIAAGQVTTSGDDSIGIYAGAFHYQGSGPPIYGAGIQVSADDIATSGSHSPGVVIEQYLGGAVDLSVGTATTTGDNSNAVTVFDHATLNPAYAGDVTIAVDKAIASGAQSDAVEAINGGTGALSIEVGEEARSDQAVGVIAASYGDLAVAVDSGALVEGGAVGIFVGNYGDATATILNQGEIAGPIAIAAAGNGVSIDNEDTVIGTVQLSDGNDLFDNAGTWELFGKSSFGGGDDLLTSSGRLLVDAGSATGTVSISDLETFDNAGLISLVDGQAGQTLRLEGTSFVGGAVGGGASAQAAPAVNGGSQLALDIGNSNGVFVADKFVIGAASGSTTITVHGTPGFGSAVLVDASSSTGADNFVLGTGSPVDAGFAILALDYDSAASDWTLASSPDTEVFETSRIVRAATSLWKRGVDAWAQLVSDGRDDTHEGVNLWGHYLGGKEHVGARGRFDVMGSTFAPDLATHSDWDGFQIGADFKRGNWTWGAMGGSLHEDTRFTADDNRVKLHGLNLGGYTAYRDGKFFVDGLINYQQLRGSVDLRSAAFSDRASGNVLGVRGDAGVALPMGELLMQPEVGVAWSSGRLHDLATAGASVDFNRFRTLEIHAGARFSGSLQAGSVTVRPYGGLYAIDQIAGDSVADFTLGSQTLRLNDKARPGYAEATAGLVIDAGRGFRISADGQADFLGGHHAWKGLIGVSWHG